MTAPSVDGTRVLVGASSFVDATAALHLIERVIHAWRPQLGGILVEETASLAICALPNQRVISASGAIALAPTRAQVSTLIEADARAFRASLSQLSEVAGKPWTFERDVGDFIQKCLRSAGAWDVLVFAHRQVHPVAGKVVLLEPPGSANEALTEMSQVLARHLSAERVVLKVNAAEETGQAQARIKTHRAGTLQDALAWLARLNAQAVLLDLSHGPVRTDEDLRDIIEVARCPVFAFGTAAAARALGNSTIFATGPVDEDTTDPL